MLTQNRSIMKSKLLTLTSCLIAASSIIGTSCVDHDYDLTKDIDLTISIGGSEFAIPGGKTEEIQLSKILKVEEGQTVKIDPKTGDYYMLQYGDPSNTSLFVEGFSMSTPIIEPIEESLEFTPLTTRSSEITFTSSILPNTKSYFNIETGVLPDEIKSLSLIEVDFTVNLRFTYTSYNINKLRTQNIQIAFPDYLVSTDLTNGIKTIEDVELIDGHPLNVSIRIQAIKVSPSNILTGIGGGIALLFQDKIDYSGNFIVSENDLRITTDEIKANLSIEASIDKIEALSVTGIIKPDVDISISPIDLDNLPDYLTNNDVMLDIKNPMILFNVANNTPISASVSGSFTSIYYNNYTNVTASFHVPEVKANETQDYCLSPINPDLPNYEWIEMANLPSLITRIPHEIDTDVKATPLDNTSTVELNQTYYIETNYGMCVPFVYGDNMNIVYTDTISGWNKDIQKYSAVQINATGYVINKIPLNLHISATAIRVNDMGEHEPLTGVQIVVSVNNVVDGEIELGNTTTGSKTAVLIEIKEVIPNAIKQLDGLILTATCNSKGVGEARLNENQTFQLIDVKLKVPGGLILDLN